MDYNHTQPTGSDSKKSARSPLPIHLHLSQIKRTQPIQSTDRQKWKYQQIILHNQQLLKQNEILSKKLSEMDKQSSRRSCYKPQNNLNETTDSQLIKVLFEVRKQRDQLVLINKQLKQTQKEREKKYSYLNKQQLKDYPYISGIQQIDALQKRISLIQNNSKQSEEELLRVSEELQKTIRQRDSILQTYQKQKEINQSIIRSMKNEIDNNKVKQKQVVQIIKILERQKNQLELQLKRAERKEGGKEMTKQNVNQNNYGLVQSLQNRVKELQNQLEIFKQQNQDINIALTKKDNYIAKTLTEHKSRLTKALQSYIERIGISKKLKPAQLLRERSSVLSEWDLNLDNPAEYQQISD